ncbi:arginine-tRNA-protein transferase [Desarmillaria tabescens]|uniref:arginyltransferase n=1 Tax=Armillaria tabescens TaxID=1929756 RepID=A0AA39NME4_ARMTA|nr:arginine-tRNA-protein transferase [Desarmillaria tabescens]KAK0468337.1 arginine-tRNA-protein transferase [Desarmillaria tabescens]
MSSNVVSVVAPYGTSSSTCGYCSTPGERSAASTSRHSASLSAIQLSCSVYQGMIDRGWRRSGTYCYKPDMRNSCCPQYPIKLDALAFKPSKSQRKLVNRWNRFIAQGNDDDEMVIDESKKPRPSKSKSKNPEFVWPNAIHASESGCIEAARHKFEVILEPSSYSEEKFALYDRYQSDIHNDFDNSSMGFKRFLVNSPLRAEPIPYTTMPAPSHLPPQYGSYHQLYRLDGQLIAMAVLDILPHCVSSVYFMYDKTWEKFSLGKVSTLREISLACEIHDAGASSMSYLYLGYYIHSCQKMRYKGQYSPSFLVDPETYEWYPLEQCTSLLDANRYACFSCPEHCTNEPPPTKDELSFPDPPQLGTENLERILSVADIRHGVVTVTPVNESSFWASQMVRRQVLGCVDGLGLDLSRKVIFHLG